MSNINPIANIASSEQVSPLEEGWESVKTRKARSVPVFKLKPEEGQFMVSSKKEDDRFKTASVIEKEKLFEFGYLQARTGMLNEEQILIYFRALQEAAVEAHFKTYGEIDESYRHAKIAINVLESKDTGKFGFANCHITNDPAHKMYWVFLGMGPKKDFPKEESVTLSDGTIVKNIVNFLEPAWIEMTEEQVVELENYKNRKFATQKISQEEYDDYKIATDL